MLDEIRGDQYAAGWIRRTRPAQLVRGAAQVERGTSAKGSRRAPQMPFLKPVTIPENG